MRRWEAIPILFVMGTGSALGQMTTADATPIVAEEPAANAWSFSASAYAYFPGDSQNYVQPTIRAD